MNYWDENWSLYPFQELTFKNRLQINIMCKEEKRLLWIIQNKGARVYQSNETYQIYCNVYWNNAFLNEEIPWFFDYHSVVTKDTNNTDNENFERPGFILVNDEMIQYSLKSSRTKKLVLGIWRN